MSGFEKRNRQKENTSRVKFRKKFSNLENFLYQEERKVLQKFLLKQEQLIALTVTFVADFSTKKRFSHKGTLCKSATVPAAVILCESAHYVTASADVGRRCEGEISQKTGRTDLPFHD